MIPTHSTSALLQNSEFRIHNSPRAFSLLEVLIATLILGIGLIMVASIFPVGATWSRQGAEETIAQNLALNAVSIIKTKYAASGTNANGFNWVTGGTYDTNDAYYKSGAWYTGAGTLVSAGTQRVFCLPNFALQNAALPLVTPRVPLSERTYAVGTGQPFPVPANATSNKCPEAQYFWTALIKAPIDGSTTVTLYILVFRRGDAQQVFTGANAVPPGASSPTALAELTDCRQIGGTYEVIGGKTFTPSVWLGSYQAGAYNAARKVISDEWPKMGSQGIGANSGTVFRQVLAANASSATPSPALVVSPQTEPIITGVAPDNWPDSPLIYIYQTQLSF